MAPILSTFTALALMVSPILASPLSSLPLLPRQDPGPGSCRNQSCMIATVAGSTGATQYNFPTYPTGDTQAGDCCIIRWFPAAKHRIYAARPGLEDYCNKNGGVAPLDKNPPGIEDISRRGEPAEDVYVSEDAAGPAAAGDVQARATCKPKILLFVKGTLEPGALGVTIGPALKQQLNPNTWDVRGVEYPNSFFNDLCLGLPGGPNVRRLLESTAAECPGSVIAVSGYSQGAMVARNALARANASAVARVKNLVTFGDPFNGAPIQQYTGPRSVFCAQGDGVCDGQLNLGAAHLSYGQNVAAAVKLLESTV